jgi:hypothetical protein
VRHTHKNSHTIDAISHTISRLSPPHINTVNGSTPDLVLTNTGSRTLTLHDPSFIRTDKPTKASTADRDGFSLNATVSCQPYQRDRLERLCRYVTRPAICLDRLTVRVDGKIQYELKNPFCRGRHRTGPPSHRSATTTSQICNSYSILKHARRNKPITPAR